MKTIASEFLHLMKEHKLLIAVVAVIAVPIMYAGMFLWAFWDPYDALEDVPVAIVNEDTGYDFEGERLDLGDELVDNLKEEADFNFHFVDKSTGMEGLENQDYYIMIEIPSYFSEHATTVMDDNPKKVDLIYTPNESYNFLAAQMGETAMLQIEAALEEKITETYAETIFDKISEVADGLKDASDATDELHDGATDLKDGSNTLEESLLTLAEKTLEFKDGVATASDGATELREGATTLSEGIGELYDNSNKLRDASSDLNSGTNELSSGINDAKSGIDEINGNLPSLIDGTSEINEGLTTFKRELPKAMTAQMEQKLEEGSETIIAGSEELRTGIVDGMENKLAPQLSNELTNGLSTGLAEGVVTEANNLIGEAPDVISNTVASEITAFIQDKETDKKDELIHILKDAEVSDETLNEVETKLDELAPNYEEIETFIAGNIQNVLDDALQDVSISEAQQKQLENLIREQIKDGIADGVDDAVQQTIGSVNEGFNTYETELTKGLEDATSGLEGQIRQALNEPIGELQDGLSQVENGQKQLADGMGELSDGASALQDGSNQLASGQQEYVNNMNKFTSSFSAANIGANELADGTLSLTSGMIELLDGSVQLNDGSNQLADGSTELNEGMGTLLDGTKEFNEEMHDAAKEAGDVKSSDATNQMIANPVDVKNEKINEVPNYGTGFAPYFLSLGLFVGALLISIVYPLREPAQLPTSGANWFISKLTVLVTVGVLQAIIACTILILGLGLEVQNVPLFYLFAILTSLVFITMVQFLVTCFDNPGRFIAIVILILQLTTSAGTFPLELIPKFLQPFNLILPMTYSVQGFKAVISSGNLPEMWQNAGILSIFMIVSMILSLIYFVFMYKKQYKEEAQTE